MMNNLLMNSFPKKSSRLFLFCFIFLFLSNSLMAQHDITGEYDLEGVMETASGILLKADHTFEIYFSYGALDKDGSGTWIQAGNEIILDSYPRPANDFLLITHKHVPGDSVTIKIIDSNKDILSYVDCLIKNDTGKIGAKTNDDGVASLPGQHVDSIGLFHEMFSDRPSFFKITDSTENYFEFTI